jgi:hypothetical protein
VTDWPHLLRSLDQHALACRGEVRDAGRQPQTLLAEGAVLQAIVEVEPYEGREARALGRGGVVERQALLHDVVLGRHLDTGRVDRGARERQIAAGRVEHRAFRRQHHAATGLPCMVGRLRGGHRHADANLDVEGGERLGELAAVKDKPSG